MQVELYLPIVVFALVIVLILLGFKTKVNHNLIQIDYGTAPLIGVFILLITFSISLGTIVMGIVGSYKIHPYSIIILFMAMAYICISLDLTGFFEYLALKVAKSAGNSGTKLFLYFYFFSGFLTIFTSNDIVILTLTPIIIYFAKYTKVDPIPYLIAQFFAANIWSIVLYIGNPTNIIVAEAYGLTFLGYSVWTLLPTLTAGLTCLILLWLVFKKKISRTLEIPKIDPKSVLKDKFGAIFGVVVLTICLLLLSLSQYLNLRLWVISLSAAIVMFIKDLIYDLSFKKRIKGNNFDKIRTVNKRMPWKIVPFLIGMFIIVEALVISGWVDLFASSISHTTNNLLIALLLMIFLSSLTCNIMNNQPMTILFTEILLSNSFQSPEIVKFGMMFALIMGSNFGANFTLIGALAGIMWHNILSDKDVKISYKQFCKYGFLIMPAVVFLSCIVLYIELLFWF